MTTTQSRAPRLSRHVATWGELVAVLVLCTAPLLVPPAAHAHRDPTLIVRITDLGATPAEVTLDVLDSELTYFVLNNPTDEPVRALDPEGDPFLQVSTDGVYGDLASQFLGASPRARAQDAEVRLSCCPDGTWVRLSSRPTWMWPDLRLDPPLRDDTTDDSRGLGQLGSEPLATWEATFASGDGEFVASGVVERKRVGAVTTTVTDAPPVLDVSVIEARPPQLRITMPEGTQLELLGDHDEPLVRVSDDGAFARADTAEYAAHLRAVRLPDSTSRGWEEMTGSAPGRVTWADPRLDYSSNLPVQGSEQPELTINEWQIPVLIDGRRAVIAGRSTWTAVKPPQLGDDVAGPGFWRDADLTSYLAAGGMTLLVMAAYWIARSRKKENPA